MSYVRQYAKDKIKALEEILADAGVTADECAYIGDDVADIPVMRRVGFAVAVARRSGRNEASRALRHGAQGRAGRSARGL